MKGPPTARSEMALSRGKGAAAGRRSSGTHTAQWVPRNRGGSQPMSVGIALTKTRMPAGQRKAELAAKAKGN